MTPEKMRFLLTLIGATTVTGDALSYAMHNGTVPFDDALDAASQAYCQALIAYLEKHAGHLDTQRDAPGEPCRCVYCQCGFACTRDAS